VPAESVSALPVAGATIDGKYRVEQVLGEGGMGVVFQAVHLRLGQRVAIKMLHPSMLRKPEIVERFEREARAAVQLRSPNAVRVLDVDVTPEQLPYMVMELLDGHDLAHELRARGRFNVPDAVDCVLQACRAMAEAHALGIVHRDLKPANLFLAREGTTTVVKVLDFGISKMAASELDVHVTSTLATMGTPLYMSPEQIRSAKSVDARADVWSLGVILFELLTGQPPFTGTAMAVSAAIVADPAPAMRALQPDIPEALEQVVAKALAKSPEARWPDVQALSLALAPFAAGRVSIQPPGVRARAASSPSMVTGPTLAATVPDSGLSPMARTAQAPLAAPGTTPAPVITAGSWASQPQGATPGTPARRSRVAVAATATLLVVALGLGGAVVLRSSRRAGEAPAATASVTAGPASSPAADVAAGPATPVTTNVALPEAGPFASAAAATATGAAPARRTTPAAPPATGAPTKPAGQVPAATTAAPANPVRL
jgi:serine/threonine-protein kinase